MIFNDELIVVGNKFNVIDVIKLNFNNIEKVVKETLFEISAEKNMLHSIVMNNNMLFIIDSYNSNVIKCDMVKNEFTGCYTGKDPRHLCIYLDNIYITNFESDSISIIDIDSFTLTGTIIVGMKPHDIVCDKLGRLYIACYEENQILRYDLNTSEKYNIDIAGKPMHMVLAGKYLYVLSYVINDKASTHIYVIDINTYSIEKTFVIDEITNNFTCDFETESLFVLAIESGSVYVIDIQSGKIKKQMHLGGYLEDVSVGKDNIYIANSGKKNISIIDKFTLKSLNNIFFEFSPEYIKII